MQLVVKSQMKFQDLRLNHLHQESLFGESFKYSSVILFWTQVGAGTDPTEGAALGMALLESFAQNGAGGSFLTMATTHHGELKTLKYRLYNNSV